MRSRLFSFLKRDRNITAPEDKAKIAEQLKITIVAAKRCLGFAEFKHYKENYQKVEKLIVEQMINYVEPSGDPVRYAMAVSDMARQLKDLGSLLNDIEIDANKKYPSV